MELLKFKPTGELKTTTGNVSDNTDLEKGESKEGAVLGLASLRNIKSL